MGTLNLFAIPGDRGKFLLAVITVLLTVSGCTLIPTYERPVPPVASQFPDVDSTQASASAATSLGWAQFFGDARLRTLIATAIDNNRDLLRATRRVEEARAVYGIQRADQYPTIGADASVNRGRTPADLSFTGGAIVASQYQVALGLRAWELDFWGRVRSLKQAALESFLASDAARCAVRVSLVAQVASSYLFERELDERIAIAQQTFVSRQESYRYARRRYEVGSSSRLDAAQAEILLNQARSELTVLGRLRAQNRNALTLLVGTPIADSTAIPLSQVEAAFVREIAPGLPSDLLINRPDVRAAEHGLKAANANIGAARAAYFPRIALTGAFGSASAELEGLFDAGSRAWNFLPSVSVPLFDGGRIQASHDLAQARRASALAEYERTVQAAFREVADALAERHWIYEQVAAQKSTLAAQIERARLARLRYDSGAASYLEVLDAERDRFAAEQALVQVRRALLASGVNLYAALGGSVSAGDEDAKRTTPSGKLNP